MSYLMPDLMPDPSAIKGLLITNAIGAVLLLLGAILMFRAVLGLLSFKFNRRMPAMIVPSLVLGVASTQFLKGPKFKMPEVPDVSGAVKRLVDNLPSAKELGEAAKRVAETGGAVIREAAKFAGKMAVAAKDMVVAFVRDFVLPKVQYLVDCFRRAGGEAASRRESRDYAQRQEAERQAMAVASFAPEPAGGVSVPFMPSSPVVAAVPAPVFLAPAKSQSAAPAKAKVANKVDPPAAAKAAAPAGHGIVLGQVYVPYHRVRPAGAGAGMPSMADAVRVMNGQIAANPGLMMGHLGMAGHPGMMQHPAMQHPGMVTHPGMVPGHAAQGHPAAAHGRR
jgi:hypothetical protein